MAGYLNISAFKLRAIIAPGHVDALETEQPGWVDAQSELVSRRIDARLGKRYAVPFATAPEIVLDWAARLLTLQCFQRLGWNPSDPQAEQIQKDADDAEAEIKEAADAVTGLYDLPLANGTSGISKGMPRVYTEASPYVWTDVQREAGRAEDSNAGGTSG